MPPRTKTDLATLTTRPVHLAELCGECGQYPNDPGYTSFTCEHGSWTFPRGEMKPDPHAAEIIELQAKLVELQAKLDATDKGK